MYEIFEHTADLGLRVSADDFPSLLAEAGRALFSVIVANLDEVRPVQEREITISGDDSDYLLFDWLNELLYLFDTERLLLSQFDVQITETGLRALVQGETMDESRHRMEHEVKAITYHGLKVEELDGRWVAEVIVDI